MKKILFSLACAVTFLASSAFAQMTFSATPGSQNVAAGGNFNVTISLSVTGTTPANVQAFDLLLETLAANSGFFSLTAANPAAPGTATSVATYPDSLTTGKSNHSGFAQNQFSQGFAFSSIIATSPFSNVTLETLTLSVAPGTPLGTYNFLTTQNATSGVRGSSVNDSNGGTFFVNNPASFSITVVPEPSTWALIASGAFGLVVVTRWRVRRVS